LVGGVEVFDAGSERKGVTARRRSNEVPQGARTINGELISILMRILHEWLRGSSLESRKKEGAMMRSSRPKSWEN
jgi:hypothetical protein